MALAVLSVGSCSPDPAEKSNASSGPMPDSSAGEHPISPAPSQNENSDPPSDDNSTSPDAPSHGPLTFHGYACLDDCSGHQAGYDWAEEHGITDPTDCGGKSQSFIEGCQAYAGEDGPDGDSEDDDGDHSDE